MPRSAACLWLIASTALATLPVAAEAQTLKSGEVLSSLVLQTLSPPSPVLGADDRIHLAYELYVNNASSMFVTLDRIEAIAPDGNTLETLEGQGLAKMLVRFSGKGAALPPSGGGIVFMDVQFAPGAPLPQSLTARVTASRAQSSPGGEPEPLDPDSPLPAHFVFTGAATQVGQSKPVIIEPPLRGNGWVAVSGCCASVTPHRGAVMAVNGQLHAPERFAIDWVQLNDQGRIFTGDRHKLSSYAYFGDPVYSVADGVAVNLYDDTPEQVPGQPPVGIKPENIGGDMLVVDIGGGAYAFYAHLQPGSLKVKLGEHVKAGEIIGLLGNTGNSTAPHLHFHIMDGPSPLNASGLPYVFTHFTGEGTVPDGAEAEMEEGRPVSVDKSDLAGSHANQMPLNNEVVGFN